MKTNVRPTSYLAWRIINDKGLLPPKRLEIYNCVMHNGPMTSMEIFQRLNLNTNSSARINELKKQGVLKEVGKRECRVTGYTAIELNVTSGLPEPLGDTSKNALIKEAKELINSINKVRMPFEKRQELLNLYKIINQL